VHRIGQLRPVAVHRVATAGSVESHMADVSQSKRALAAKLARAVAGVARAARKELGVPEPLELDDGDGRAGEARGDATGAGGEDTYDAALERRAAAHAAKGPITSGRGLVGHAWTEAMEAASSAADRDDAKRGLVLGAVWEAASRGRDPRADPAWVARRFEALAGGGAAAAADGAADGAAAGAAGAPLNDPDAGWDDEKHPPRSLEPARAAAFVEVAAVAAAAAGAAAAAPGAGGAAAPHWIRLGELAGGGAGAWEAAFAAPLPAPVAAALRADAARAGGARARLGVRVVIDAADGGSPAAAAVPVAATRVDGVDWDALCGGAAR